MSRRDSERTGNLVALLTLALLVMLSLQWCSEYAKAQTVTPKQTLYPPMVVRVEQAGTAYAPGNMEIVLPAGTEIDACTLDDGVLRYDLASRTQVILQPCPPRPQFIDSFEASR